MRTGIFALAAIATALISVITGQRARHLSPEAKHVLQWYNLQAAQLDKEAALLLDAVEQQDSEPEIQQQFLETRLAYKRLELLAEYFHPSTASALNNPRLEQMLFPHITQRDTASIRAATQQFITNARMLEGTLDSLKISDAQLFDAMRLEIARILALGISGFDSPHAQESISEAQHALEGVKAVWLFYREGLEKRNPDLADRTQQLFIRVHRMLDTSTDFSAFSRMAFINEYLNPLAVQIKLTREALKIPYSDSVQFLDPAASHVFAKGAFNLSATDWQMNSRFDKFMRGDARQMDAKEVNGFNLFMGKAKCGTCHFAPLFNGNAPSEDQMIVRSSTIRNNGDTMHYFQHLTAAEQQDIFAFMQTLNDAETVTSR